MIGLTKAAAGEVARQRHTRQRGVPGPDRHAHDPALESQLNPADPGSVAAHTSRRLPIGRYGTAEEVANMVLFLCSDLAGNITGAQYVVDGGRTATPGAVTSMNR